MSIVEDTVQKYEQQRFENERQFFEFDFSDWNLGSFMDYSAAFKDNDLESLIRRMMSATRSWKYDTDPHDIESWRNLTFSQWSLVVKAFSASLTAAFR